MAIRTMLAPLGGAEDDDTFLDTVFGLAKRYGAHADVLQVVLDPRDAVAFVGEGMTAAMIEQIMAAAEKEGGSRASRANEQFDRAVGKFGALVREDPGPGFSVRLFRRTGREDEQVAERGRLADLIIAGHPGKPPRAAPSFTLDACLRETGRPVLVLPLPAPPPEAFGKRIAIAWNGSTEAGRALRAAMPFLEQAESVSILTVEEGSTVTPTGDNVVRYLGWCGVKATTVAVPTDPAGAGKALMAAVVASNADMLIMGAYTRGQMRRLIFGGVTAEVLAQITVPVIMVH